MTLLDVFIPAPRLALTDLPDTARWVAMLRAHERDLGLLRRATSELHHLRVTQIADVQTRLDEMIEEIDQVLREAPRKEPAP